MMKWPGFGVLLAVFVFFSFAFPSAVHATVPDPTNVSVTCHNFKNVLYWNYSGPELQPEFHIGIQGYESGFTRLHTNQTYLDISEYTLNAENGYYITVEAQTKGSESSTSSRGNEFSYNEDVISDFTCMVDFPVLDVSVLPHRVKLSFEHPYYIYRVESLEAEFFYSIVHNKTKSNYVCNLEDEMCVAEFHLFPDVLYGSCTDVHIEGFVNRIPIKTVREVCSHGVPNKTDWTLILTIVISFVIVFMILLFLGALVYNRLIKPDPSSTVISKILRMVNSDRILHEPEQPAVSEVRSLGQTPLLETTDMGLFDPSSPTLEEPTHLPTHFISRVMFSDDQDTGQGDVTEETESGDFNSGNSFSGYDSKKFPIDMGQGDIVEAYGPR